MKLISRKLTKQKMIKMAKLSIELDSCCLYYIEESPADDPYSNSFSDTIEVKYTEIEGIKVNLKTGCLEFITSLDDYCSDDEPLFVSRRTAEIFMKQHYNNYKFCRDKYGRLYGIKERRFN